MAAPLFVRIFLSSPGDVAQERTLAHQVIDNLMHDALLRDKVVLKAVAWDKRDSRTPMLATLTPQEAINEGLPKSSDCDIVIVILWSRIGTPLPAEYKKPDGSPYLSGTEYEFEDAMNAARNCRTRPVRPQVLVYWRTEDVVFNPKDPDFIKKYEQWRHVQDFFNAFVAPGGSLTGGYNTYATPDDFRADLENDLKVIISRLLEAPPLPADKAPAPPPADLADLKPPERWKGSPFPGLRAFMPDDAPIFFGRGRETDSLIARLADPACRFVCVVGASGSGKSSLVGAGLLPRLMGNVLEGSKDWAWTRFTPGEIGDDPFVALANALTKKIPALEKRWPRARDLAAAIAANPNCLIDAGVLADRPAWAELLLFIDQFEELFTLAAERCRQPFVDLLDRLANMPRLRIVATLRADFYHRCVEMPKLTVLLRSGSYPLAAPELDALLEMITRPADRAGLAFETGLSGRILKDTGADPGALALMAYTLDELYQHCQAHSSTRLTHAAYKGLGGVQGAIGTRAQHVFDQLDKPTQDALPEVFRNLVEVDDRGTATRQRATLDRLTHGDAYSPAATLIVALTEARLLVQNRGVGDYPVVEVAHEALLRSWPKLAAWIAEAQEDLILLRQVKAAADQWEQSGRNRAFLWPHERLRLVYAMLERLKSDLDEVTRDFIKLEFERLMDEISDLTTNHRRRALIGDRLAEIGDNRPGVGLQSDGLPDLVWCDVPGGSVTLEGVEGTFEVQPFHIAQYPVTYVQYRAFLDAEDGYHDDRWWEGLYRDDQPGTQNRPTDNHPAENVSWFDAMAFCRWLSAKLGAEVRLPTEWEWQQAATGGNPKNEYPWGADWDSAKANTSESGLSRTTAVGVYPQGAVTGLAVLDMSGNVWEWCLNSYKEPDSTDCRDDLARIMEGKGSYDGPSSRVVRGGSWFNGSDRARAAFDLFDPAFRYSAAVGFRVVLVGGRPPY
jgi:formylglycine-generating enzyme required for sulfatase activity